MNFSCEKNIILDAVNTVIRTIPIKSSIPVLEGIYMEIDQNGILKLIGSDSDMSIETTLNVDSDTSMKFVLPAKTFSDMLMKMENGIVYFEIDNNKIMNIVCGVIKYKLPIMDANLYPTIPIVEKSKIIKMKKSLLHSMLRQTLFSISVKDTRPILKGALFDIKKDSLSVVTSDTFRLAVRTEPYENLNSDEFKFVVPGKTINELLKIMKNDDDNEITIGLASTHAIFELDNTKITTRLISGDFIKYQSMIPKTFKTTAITDSENMKKSIDRASVLINEKIKKPVRMSFEFDTIIISYKSPEGISLTDEIKASIEGEKFEIGFNDKYITDALNGCECEKIKLSLNSPMTALCITPTDSEKFIYLISPMRIS